MAGALDMSLDDLITKNKPQLPRRRRRNTASGSGSKGPAPTGRRFHSRDATRAAAAPYHQLAFHHQAPAAYGFAAQPMIIPPPSGGVDTGAKLYISNLDYNVNNEDIKEIFSEMGDVKRYSINYDKSGRSKGTAEVVFSRRADALAALKKYNEVHLDGKPMKIEVIGTNIEAPAPAPAPAPASVPAIFAFTMPPGNFTFPPKSDPRRFGGGGSPRGGGGFGGRGARGRGRGGRGNQPLSAEDLDADLDKYHSAAMQIS